MRVPGTKYLAPSGRRPVRIPGAGLGTGYEVLDHLTFGACVFSINTLR